MTGDKYEDYPEDHPDHESFDGPKVLQIATDIKDYGNKAYKSGDLRLGLDKYLKGLRYLHNFDAGDSEKGVAEQMSTLHVALECVTA